MELGHNKPEENNMLIALTHTVSQEINRCELSHRDRAPRTLSGPGPAC